MLMSLKNLVMFVSLQLLLKKLQKEILAVEVKFIY